MKKIAALLLSFLLVCSLTVCGSQGQETGVSEASSDSLETVESVKSSEAENAEETSESMEMQSAQEPLEASSGSNTLIVYFSRYGNTEYPEDVDATTSASIVDDGEGRYGTTEYVANLIQQTVGGDLHSFTGLKR